MKAGSRPVGTRRPYARSHWSRPPQVAASNAIRTLPFWLLWIVLFCNVTAGIGILEQAGPMIQDFFRVGGESSVAVSAAAWSATSCPP